MTKIEMAQRAQLRETIGDRARGFLQIIQRKMAQVGTSRGLPGHIDEKVEQIFLRVRQSIEPEEADTPKRWCDHDMAELDGVGREDELFQHREADTLGGP